MNKLLLIIFFCIAFNGYAQKIPADLLVYNAQIYTVDEQFLIQEAMAIKDGKILATGTTVELQNKFSSKKNLDANQKFVYPGFIDAHAHFFEYGLGLQSVDLTGTKSWEEIILKLKAYSLKNKFGWIIGKGWDQNDWEIKTFPNSQQLDQLFPNRPVFLSRVDGHAAIANSIAMKGIQPGTKLIGGEVETKDGKLTGILVDNAVKLVSKNIPAPNFSKKRALYFRLKRIVLQWD
jgi:predicted amidohydrolase YtcJ